MFNTIKGRPFKEEATAIAEKFKKQAQQLKLNSILIKKKEFASINI